MNDITISAMNDAEEIEILRNKTSKYKNLTLAFSQPTIDLLKKNIKLKDSLYLVAKQDNEFVGFCSIDRDWWEDGYFMIREIFIEPNFQKQGIGEKLVGRCIEHAKKLEATGVVTETAFENLPMQKLCAKFDFKEWDNPQWKEGITYKLIF